MCVSVREREREDLDPYAVAASVGDIVGVEERVGGALETDPRVRVPHNLHIPQMARKHE